jgi:hypothetical protein
MLKDTFYKTIKKEIKRRENKKALLSNQESLVPRIGFEPTRPCERCHLKAVRLPISPSGRGEPFKG